MLQLNLFYDLDALFCDNPFFRFSIKDHEIEDLTKRRWFGEKEVSLNPELNDYHDMAQQMPKYLICVQGYGTIL
jgi:hypothetical protein